MRHAFAYVDDTLVSVGQVRAATRGWFADLAVEPPPYPQAPTEPWPHSCLHAESKMKKSLRVRHS
jgi:hypothetical protein